MRIVSNVFGTVYEYSTGNSAISCE